LDTKRQFQSVNRLEAATNVQAYGPWIAALEPTALLGETRLLD